MTTEQQVVEPILVTYVPHLDLGKQKGSLKTDACRQHFSVLVHRKHRYTKQKQ